MQPSRPDRRGAPTPRQLAVAIDRAVHPATAWALAASTIVFVTAGLSHGFDSGLRGALAAFVAWAIVRELAPRRALASLIAPFAAVAFAIPARTDMLACVGVLLASRIALRSVGDPLTGLDRVLLVGFAAWCATRPEGLPVAVVLAAVLLGRRGRRGWAALGWRDARCGTRRRLARGDAHDAPGLGRARAGGAGAARPAGRRIARAARVAAPATPAHARRPRPWAPARCATAQQPPGRRRVRGRGGAWTGSAGAFALSSASAAVVAGRARAARRKGAGRPIGYAVAMTNRRSEGREPGGLMPSESIRTIGRRRWSVVIIRKSRKDIELMQRSGALLAEVHDLLAPLVQVGVTTAELDRSPRSTSVPAAACRPSRATRDSRPPSARASTRRWSTASRTRSRSPRATCSRSTAASRCAAG